MPSVYTTAKPTKTASFASISSDGTIGGRPGLLPARLPQACLSIFPRRYPRPPSLPKWFGRFSDRGILAYILLLYTTW